MNERIEELAKKFAGGLLGVTFRAAENVLRAALTELAAEHAMEMRAQDATIANLQERVRQLEAERVPEWIESISRVPDENQIVVVLHPHKKSRDGFARAFSSWSSEGDGWSIGKEQFIRDNKFWMPLPSAPEQNTVS